MAETPTTTFSGTVYYKNYIASGATVSVSYAMHTYSTTADENGNYSLTVDYVGNGKAVLTASYNGDIDIFTWYTEANAHVAHDFWITPRPVSQPEQPTATFNGRIYYGNVPAMDAHVILVYGKYVLDQYANDTGHYSLTVYYQGMPGRIWATYGEGRSDDYWPNPGMGGTTVTDIHITPVGNATVTPSSTPAPTTAPTATPVASPTATPKPTPAGIGTLEALLISMAGISTAFLLQRRKW